jgi:broad specificity phosphatase PhoE
VSWINTATGLVVAHASSLRALLGVLVKLRTIRGLVSRRLKIPTGT